MTTSWQANKQSWQDQRNLPGFAYFYGYRRTFISPGENQYGVVSPVLRFLNVSLNPKLTSQKYFSNSWDSLYTKYILNIKCHFTCGESIKVNYKIDSVCTLNSAAIFDVLSKFCKDCICRIRTTIQQNTS